MTVHLTEPSARGLAAFWAIFATVLASRAAVALARRSWAALLARLRGPRVHSVQGVTVARSTTWMTVETQWGLGDGEPNVDQLWVRLLQLKKEMSERLSKAEEGIEDARQEVRAEAESLRRAMDDLRQEFDEEERRRDRWDARAVPLLGWSVVLASIPDVLVWMWLPASLTLGVLVPGTLAWWLLRSGPPL